MTAPELKAEILRLSREYSAITHAAQRPGNDSARAPFVAGESVVPYAGRVFTEDEVEAAVGATLDFWLTLGPEGEAFERELRPGGRPLNSYMAHTLSLISSYLPTPFRNWTPSVAPTPCRSSRPKPSVSTTCSSRPPPEPTPSSASNPPTSHPPPATRNSSPHPPAPGATSRPNRSIRRIT